MATRQIYGWRKAALLSGAAAATLTGCGSDEPEATPPSERPAPTPIPLVTSETRIGLPTETPSASASPSAIPLVSPTAIATTPPTEGISFGTVITKGGRGDLLARGSVLGGCRGPVARLIGEDGFKIETVVGAHARVPYDGKPIIKMLITTDNIPMSNIIGVDVRGTGTVVGAKLTDSVGVTPEQYNPAGDVEVGFTFAFAGSSFAGAEKGGPFTLSVSIRYTDATGTIRDDEYSMEGAVNINRDGDLVVDLGTKTSGVEDKVIERGQDLC